SFRRIELLTLCHWPEGRTTNAVSVGGVAMPRKFLCLLAGAAFAAFFNQQVVAQSVARIWAINDGEKVERDDRNHPQKTSNSVWDGRRIKLFGGRNEIIAFQIIVEADGKGIEKLAATMRELKLKGGSAKIEYAPPGSDPSQSVGRPIQIFSVNYM